MSRGLRKIRRTQQRDLLRKLGLGNQSGVLRFVGSVWNEQMEKYKQMALAEAEMKEQKAAEDNRDLEIAQAALQEPGEKSWEEVKADLAVKDSEIETRP